MKQLVGLLLILIFMMMPTLAQDDTEPESNNTQNEVSSTSDAVIIQLFVSVDGGTTWQSAPDNRIEAAQTTNLLLRFIVRNDSDEQLTAIDLSDSTVDISGCDIPATLAADDDFDCTVTLTLDSLDDDVMAYAVVVSGDINGDALVVDEALSIVVDEAFGDSDSAVIVLEGPITAIDANQVTIYNFTIALADDAPLLTAIEIGDVLRIEGIWDAESPVIQANIVVVVNVDVSVYEGEVWRDDGDCGNGPPPWAPAHGWRQRCEGGRAANVNNGGNGNGNANGNSNGRGRGNGRGR